MATTKVTPFVSPEQDSALTLEELHEAKSEFKLAWCAACGERFARKVDADIHRIESVECGWTVFELWDSKPVN